MSEFVGVDGQRLLAVIQSDLQLICSMRNELEARGFRAVNVARNSEEAILYLRGVGIYDDRVRFPVPTALVLDCQNPDASDLEVLSWVREKAEFRELPVFLLCPEHHRLHVNCALDQACVLIDRDDLSELAEALQNSELFVEAAAQHG